MKQKINMLFLLCIMSLTAFTTSAKNITCTIKGKVIDRDSKTILLHKGTEDTRSNYVVIPIVENTFEYTFTVSAPEVYHLVFEDEFNSGTWRRIEFFPEEGKVLFTLYPMMEGDKNKIEGGKLNKQLRDYWLAYTKNYQEKVDPKSEPLTEKIRELWNIGEGESPKADSLRRERDVFENRQKDWYYNYIDSNPSLVSYYLFTSNLLIIAEYPNDIISHRASMFSKLYPDHPYSV